MSLFVFLSLIYPGFDILRTVGLEIKLGETKIIPLKSSYDPQVGIKFAN